jgi:hypothetical protein
MTSKYRRQRSRYWSELPWYDKVGEVIAATIVLALPVLLIWFAYVLGG